MVAPAFSLATGFHFPATLQFVDAFGNSAPAPAGIVPVWAVDQDSILTVVAAADGMSAVCTTVGPEGVANITVDDGTGTGQIVGTLAVTVTAGNASAINIIPGTPVANA